MSLVRRGAQALAHPELDINEMLNWDWQTMIEKCKDKPADVLVAKDTATTGCPSQIKDEDEKQWLSKMEVVESRVFQGRTYTKAREAPTNGTISEEWSRAQRRIGKNTTVMIDGFAINKESLQCADWEAVPTMAGKDPRLAEVRVFRHAAQRLSESGDADTQFNDSPSATKNRKLSIKNIVLYVGMAVLLCSVQGVRGLSTTYALIKTSRHVRRPR